MWLIMSITISGTIAGLWIVWKYINYNKTKKYVEIMEYRSTPKYGEISCHDTSIPTTVETSTKAMPCPECSASSFPNNGDDSDNVLKEDLDTKLLPEMETSDDEYECSKPYKNDMQYFII